MTTQASASRSGLTLLEVVVGMAIFLMSVIAIFQLLLMGTERAQDVRLQTRTSMRCQSKLAEVIIGAQGMDSTSNYAYYDDPDKDLQWKIKVTPGEVKGVQFVEVWVKTDLPNRTVESYLCQNVLTPSMRGTTFDQPKSDTGP